MLKHTPITTINFFKRKEDFIRKVFVIMASAIFIGTSGNFAMAQTNVRNMVANHNEGKNDKLSVISTLPSNGALVAVNTGIAFVVSDDEFSEEDIRPGSIQLKAGHKNIPITLSVLEGTVSIIPTVSLLEDETYVVYVDSRVGKKSHHVLDRSYEWSFKTAGVDSEVHTQAMLMSVTSWSSMTQAQRNQAIINKAVPQIGSYGGECKAWVQGSVVYPASGYTIFIPANMPPPNDYSWYSSACVTGCCGAPCAPLTYAVGGEILQMKFPASAHTAIIESVDASGMYWLDSNWASPHDGIVRRHYITYTSFYSKLYSTWTFTKYRVNGNPCS